MHYFQYGNFICILTKCEHNHKRRSLLPCAKKNLFNLVKVIDITLELRFFQISFILSVGY